MKEHKVKGIKKQEYIIKRFTKLKCTECGKLSNMYMKWYLEDHTCWSCGSTHHVEYSNPNWKVGDKPNWFKVGPIVNILLKYTVIPVVHYTFNNKNMSKWMNK